MFLELGVYFSLCFCPFQSLLTMRVLLNSSPGMRPWCFLTTFSDDILCLKGLSSSKVEERQGSSDKGSRSRITREYHLLSGTVPDLYTVRVLGEQ